MRYDICQNNPQRRFGNFDNSNDYFRSLFDSKNSTRTVRDENGVSLVSETFFFFETNFEDEVENLYRVALFACFETRIISEF